MDLQSFTRHPWIERVTLSMTEWVSPCLISEHDLTAYLCIRAPMNALAPNCVVGELIGQCDRELGCSSRRCSKHGKSLWAVLNDLFMQICCSTSMYWHGAMNTTRLVLKAFPGPLSDNIVKTLGWALCRLAAASQPASMQEQGRAGIDLQLGKTTRTELTSRFCTEITKNVHYLFEKLLIYSIVYSASTFSGYIVSNFCH